MASPSKMCDALVVRSSVPVRSSSTEVLTTGAFSIVVEGVDGEPPVTDDAVDDSESEDEEQERTEINQGSTPEAVQSTPRGSKRGSRRGSRAAAKEEAEQKLAIFKVSFILTFSHILLSIEYLSLIKYCTLTKPVTRSLYQFSK